MIVETVVRMSQRRRVFKEEEYEAHVNRLKELLDSNAPLRVIEIYLLRILADIHGGPGRALIGHAQRIVYDSLRRLRYWLWIRWTRWSGRNPEDIGKDL